MAVVSYWFIMALYYKMWQILLQNATAILLQNASGFLLQNTTVLLQNAKVITKFGSYYKVWRLCCKMQQLLQNNCLLQNVLVQTDTDKSLLVCLQW